MPTIVSSGTELLHLPQLIEEILQRELAFAHLLLEPLRVIDVHRLGGPFDETDHVAHAQNARGHALRMERLEVLELFTHADELDRLAGDGAYMLRAAPPRASPSSLVRIAAGDVQGLIEMRGDIHRFLAGGGVEHEQDFLRLDQSSQRDQFLDERFVNLQTAGGVENEGVAVVGPGEIKGLARDLEHIRFALLGEDGHTDLLAELLQLVHGRRSINVGRDEQRGAALFAKRRASLPLEVVLPEPCRPTIRMEAGLCR